MLPTSPQYKQAIKSLTRGTEATIYFGLYDVTAKDGATPSTNVQSQPFSDINAVIDEFRYPIVKVGTLEENMFRLDGSFKSLEESVTESEYRIGWWSKVQSGSDRTFATNPIIEIELVGLHSSVGIELFFDPTTHCEAFNIIWYNGNSILSEKLVEGNNSQRCFVENIVENYDKIMIELIRTDKPYRFAKVSEVNFGGEEIFDNAKIKSARIVEEIDPVSGKLSYNTLKFTVLNEDQRFNVLNPTGIYRLLQRRQKLNAEVRVYVGAEDAEVIPLGTYYLSDWKNSTGLTAELEASDAIGLLDRTTYYSSPFWVNALVSDILEHILNDAGDFTLNIDPALQGLTLTGYVPVTSHRQAILYVLVACRCALRKGRDGSLNLIRIDYDSEPVESIDMPLILGEPKIEQKPIITSVQCREFSYTEGMSPETLHESTFDLNGTTELLIDFGGAAKDISISVIGSGSLVSSASSAVASKVTINGSGQVTLLITGKRYIESSRVITASLQDIPAGEVPQVAVISDNKLITNGAIDVANDFLSYYQKRIKIKFNYWSDPSLEAGDIISVETMFSQKGVGAIERQEVTFSPGLKSTMEVVGGYVDNSGS